MPELPDITVYLECLHTRCAGQILERIRISGPALLRSVDPPISEINQKRVVGFRRIGKRVASFHDKMAVHGKYRQPCPVCASPIQRIVYANNETNYCATDQTGGCLLTDRAMSQLLEKDWPRSLEELEARRQRGQSGLTQQTDMGD